MTLLNSSSLSGSTVDEDVAKASESVVFVMIPGSAFAVRAKLAEPVAKLAPVHVTAPGTPTAGGVQDQPGGAAMAPKPRPAGRIVVIVAFAALSGPAFATVIGYR